MLPVLFKCILLRFLCGRHPREKFLCRRCRQPIMIHGSTAQCCCESPDTPSARHCRATAPFPVVSGGDRISCVAPAVARKGGDGISFVAPSVAPKGGHPPNKTQEALKTWSGWSSDQEKIKFYHSTRTLRRAGCSSQILRGRTRRPPRSLLILPSR